MATAIRFTPTILGKDVENLQLNEETAVGIPFPLHEQRAFTYPKDYDPGIGPYSMKELNARIDRTEEDHGNPDNWIRVDNFWETMKKEHSWL